MTSRSNSAATTAAKSDGGKSTGTPKSGGSTATAAAKSDGGGGGGKSAAASKSGGGGVDGGNSAASAASGGRPVKYCARPVRGVSGVTDDRWSAAADAAKCGPPCCVPNGCAKPEWLYACDRQAAKALAQYVSPDERAKVLRWLDVLQHAAADDPADEDRLSERSMYLTCLLMLLRAGRLVAPFTRAPPPAGRALKPLRDAIDRRLYKRVQIECRRRRLNERARYERADHGGGGGASEFFDSMPRPQNGVLCYGAAFSNMT